jgi:hypothetical protein
MIKFYIVLSIIWLLWYLGEWLVAFFCFIKYLKE